MRTPSLLRRAAAALTAFVAVVAAVRAWGLQLVADGAELKLRAVPWFGRWETTERATMLVWPAVVALVVVVLGPRVASRLRFGWLALVSAVASLAWAVALYVADRPLGQIGAPLEGRFDYLAALPRVHDVGTFVRTYVDELATYPIHVQGHPPGMVLVLWLLDRVGLGGSTWAAVLVLAVGASASAAVLLTARELLPEPVARRCAPFLALAPAAIWMATTADAFFTGIGAWAIALVVLGTRDERWRSVVAAGVGGALFAVGLHLTYGLAPLGLVPAWVIVSRRSWRALGAGCAAGAAVVGAFAATGFFLPDGLDATTRRYEAGISSERPFTYFVVANLAVLAVSVGPGAIVGLATRRRDLPLGFVVAALVAVLAADLSGLSKGEVERIWLPYVPWLLVFAGVTAFPMTRGVGGRFGADRALLTLQAATGIVLAAFLRSPW